MAPKIARIAREKRVFLIMVNIGSMRLLLFILFIRTSTFMAEQAVRAIIPERLQEKWIQSILKGNDEPLIALLILHCPLLKTIDWEVQLMHKT